MLHKILIRTKSFIEVARTSDDAGRDSPKPLAGIRLGLAYCWNWKPETLVPGLDLTAWQEADRESC